ncbi:MAG: tyrosine-type recombinase/integrase [Magnetococcales bacterium]|nr:tyrosine-type recombinase/integrase [Magnetococcales bacterium]
MQDTLPAVAQPSAIAIPDDLLANLARFSQYAKGALSASTEKALRSDLRLFVDWCAKTGAASLPASPETVAQFVEAMAATSAPASIRRYLSSISTYHKAAGLPTPTATMEVRLTMKRIAKEKGTRQKQASPINRRVVDLMAEADRGTLRDMRDLAILAVAYDTLCRRSEIVALDVEDFSFAEDGTGTVLVRRSKTDQEGAGSVRFIASDTVQSVKAWLDVVGISKGAAFRGLDNSDKVLARLSDRGVARAFKRLAGLAKVDGEGISGHSCRVGAAQDMVGEGIELPAVMQAGGWRSPVMVARYTEKLAVRRGAAAKLAAIQNRL